MSTLTPVNFHDDTLYVTEHNGEPFVPMKPVVENMGLDWKSQYAKINHNRQRWGMVMITVPSDGGRQHSICIPLRKLPGFLATINPLKVRNELRHKITLYQNECDDALWAYWSGIKPKPQTDDIAATVRLAIRSELAKHLPGNPPANTPVDQFLIDQMARIPKKKMAILYTVIPMLAAGIEFNWEISPL